MESLTAIANTHGTDKGTFGPSTSWHMHNYTDIYEAYLGHLRHEPIRIVEVGLGVTGDAWKTGVAHGRNAGGGASMRMWYDFFPKASIFGADINPASFLDNDRIKTFRLDQSDFAQLSAFGEEVGGEFDFIVDDGSHRADHQQVTFAALFPHLKAGGVYFVEDLMRNGVGDGDRGRFSADHDVVNTRRLFGTFRDDGVFPEPNDLTDAAGLSEQIESVGLHVPMLRLNAQLALETNSHVARAGQVTAAFMPNTEKLVAIRKKA